MTSEAQDRVHELLADRATVGLRDAEAHELATLLKRHPELGGPDNDSFDLAAAAIGVAMNGAGDSMPTSLRRRVMADAEAWFTRTDRTHGRWVYWSGWLAAAASLLLAFVIWTRDGSPAMPTAAERRAALAATTDAVVLGWQPTADPAAADAGGDVVWSGDRQEGYMRFRGLAANDPADSQYQLWIFDSARNGDYPVDGGVFDVPAGAGDWVVPIRARLPVSEAVLFAVTVEPPGGVVVSTRERIALTAQPQG